MTSAGVERTARQSLRILVVEDDDATRMVACTFLEGMGHTVIAVSNGYDAIASSKREAPELVLLDISLPDLDGIATARKIREAVEDPVPILAMSAHVYADEVERYLSSGINGFVAKPFTPESLFDAICAVLPLNLDQGRFRADLKALGTEQMRRLLGIVEETMPPRLDAMRSAVDTGDYARLADLAHATRSTAASAGFIALLQAAEALERAAKVHNDTAARNIMARCDSCYWAAISEAKAEVGIST
jgi:two-component system sensor histidine kinase TorS